MRSGGLRALLARFRRDPSGATAIEYGLITLLIFLAIVGALRTYSNAVGNLYGNILAAALAGGI